MFGMTALSNTAPRETIAKELRSAHARTQRHAATLQQQVADRVHLQEAARDAGGGVQAPGDAKGGAPGGGSGVLQRAVRGQVNVMGSTGTSLLMGAAPFGAHADMAGFRGQAQLFLAELFGDSGLSIDSVQLKMHNKAGVFNHASASAAGIHSSITLAQPPSAGDAPLARPPCDVSVCGYATAGPSVRIMWYAQVVLLCSAVHGGRTINSAYLKWYTDAGQRTPFKASAKRKAQEDEPVGITRDGIVRMRTLTWEKIVAKGSAAPAHRFDCVPLASIVNRACIVPIGAGRFVVNDLVGHADHGIISGLTVE